MNSLRYEILEHQKLSELFFNNVYVLPLWVKQVLYIKTQQRLNEELDEFNEILNNPEVLIQNYVPRITFKGKQELEKRSLGLTENFYTFLKGCIQSLDLFDIALENFWTMAETAKVFVRCVELELINIPENEKNYAVAQFLAGKLRTGEVLRKLGKIDVVQLEKAIREQKEMQKRGDNARIADVMIGLGFITEKDVKILLTFKEDSRKRFIMGLGLASLKLEEQADAQHAITSLQKEIKRLDQENKILKSRLRKLLNIQE